MKRIWLLIIAFCISFNTFSQEKKMIDQIIAIIGNTIIKQSEIEYQFIEYQRQGLPVEDMTKTKCKLFEQILMQKLMITQAILDSVEVSEKEVEAELSRRVMIFENQAGGRKNLEEYFKKTINEIKEDFRDDIKNQLQAQRMQETITKDIKVTPSDVQKYFKTMHPDSIPLIEAELEISQLTKFPILVEEEKQLSRNKLLEAREKLLKGESWFSIALRYSDDPGSRDKSGELDYMGRGELVPEFASIAFNLEIGELSNIVETDFGYHVIQLIDKKDDKVKVRHILVSPIVSGIAKNKAKEFLDSIAILIRIDSLTFEQAAVKFSDDENTKNNGGSLMNMVNGSNKFHPDDVEPAINARIKNMKVGEMTNPFESFDERGRIVYKIIKLKSKTKAHKANLIDDYQLLQDAALNHKKQKAIDEWIKEKQQINFIRIDENYRNCEFEYKGWFNQIEK